MECIMYLIQRPPVPITNQLPAGGGFFCADQIFPVTEPEVHYYVTRYSIGHYFHPLPSILFLYSIQIRSFLMSYCQLCHGLWSVFLLVFMVPSYSAYLMVP